MTKITIVPEEHWAILREYLYPAQVLIPQHVLESLPESQKKVLQEIGGSVRDYSFGGEPDIVIDTILDKDSFALEELAPLSADEE